VTARGDLKFWLRESTEFLVVYRGLIELPIIFGSNGPELMEIFITVAGDISGINTYC